MRVMLCIGVALFVILSAVPSHAVTPIHLWSLQSQGTTAVAQALAIDGSGDVVVAGHFSGTVDFGGGNLQSAGYQNNDTDIFVAKYSQNGAHQWSQRFGSAGFDSCLAVAVDGSGNILVTGCFDSNVNFGGATLVSAGLQDIFVAKFAPDGTHQWSQRFGGTGTDYGQGIAVDGSGNVIVTGFFRSTVDFGGGNLVSAGWTPGLALGDVFLAKYDANGVHQWSKRFGDVFDDAGVGVAVGTSDNIVMTGTFHGTVDFGGGNLTTSAQEAFVALYDAAGVYQWSRRSVGNVYASGNAVTVDGSGNVIVSGSLWGNVDLGGGNLADLGSGDAFVAKYDAGGVHQWSHRFGGGSYDNAFGVGVDGAGNVLITGRYTGVANFGGGDFTSPGYLDVFLAEYDANGAHRWSRTGGVTYAGWGTAVGSDASDNVITTGTFQGTANFGGADLVNAHASVYVAKYSSETASECHDGLWDDGEYCGRDAYVNTLYPEMNHDCLIDGLDVGLFIDKLYTTGVNLSADLDDDGDVDVFGDYILFAPKVGSVADPCNGSPTPTVLQGTIAVSYSANPATIVSTTVEAPGAHSMYVVINGFNNAKFVEYAIHTTPGVFITASTLMVPGIEGPSCNTGTFNTVVALTSPLASGPTVIARIDYDLQTTAPTTFTIAPANCSWARVRWAKASADTSYEFANISNAQTNPVGSFGTVSGNIYGDVAGDCAFNGPDLHFGSRIVRATPGTYSATTDDDGNYVVYLPPGAYSVGLSPAQNDSWKKSACQVSAYAVNVTTNGAILGKDFSLKPVGTIAGTVYLHTLPSGCAYNAADDFEVAGRMVIANPGGYIGYSGADGKYALKVPIGQYTVSQVQLSDDPWLPHPCQTNPTYLTNVFTNSITGGKDFAVTHGQGYECNSSVSIVRTRIITSPVACPSGSPKFCAGSQSEYAVVVSVDYWATEPLAAGSRLNVTFDPSVTVDGVPTSGCSIGSFSTSGFNQVSMTINETIYPGHSCVVYVRGTISASSTGYLYENASLANFGPCSQGSKTSQLRERPTCGSCDPNDLVVSPGCGDDGAVLGSTPLVYRIHFSNIGLGPAQKVFIEDVLDSDLDLSTLSIVASDHTVTSWQVDPGRKLVINFDEINLPGTSGPGDPNGYVVFRISPNDDLANGTTIQNTAAITFDYNDPVITNTVINTISSNPCPLTGVEEPTLPLAHYLGLNHPNPFNPITTIEYGLASQQQVVLAIYDIKGALVRTLVSETKPAGWYNVNWDGRDQKGNRVASGVYLSRMVAGSFINTRKLVLLK